MEDNALMVRGTNFLAPVAAVEDVLAAYQLKKEIVERILRPGVDYGKIPGSDKDALLKPGAEKFANMYGLSPVFEDVMTVEDWTGADHKGEPFFYYRQKIKLYKGDMLMGTADGSCNSWEKKYRYRKQERTCPACGLATVIKGKQEYGGGWLCWRKNGGCGAKFSDGDAAIESQEVGTIANPDVAEQVNTILKMAQKRALVAGVLIVTGASDYFTQDIEDFIEGSFIDPEPTPQQTTKAKATPRKTTTNGHGPAAPVASAPQVLVDAGICNDIPSAAGLLNSHVPAEVRGDNDALVAWGKLYRSWRDAGTEPSAAAENATAGIALD